MIEETQSIIFSTVNSTNKNSSSPFFTLNKKISNADSYACISFNGVNSTYNVDVRNNNIRFIDAAFPGTVAIAEIPTGNYTLETYLTAIGTAMTAAGAQTYTASNDSFINKISISSVGPFKIIESTFFYESGFNVSSDFSNPQIAQNTYDLSGLKQILVVCQSLENGNSMVSGKNINVIFNIPILTPYLGVVSFNPTPLYISSQIKDLEYFEFILLDERYRPLTDLKDWSVVLAFRNVL